MRIANHWVGAAVFYDAGFAVFHLLFWRVFQWPRRLAASGPVNSAVTQTLNVMLIYVFVSYALALTIVPESALAPMLFLGAGFWLMRTFAQPALFVLRRRTNAVMAGIFTAGFGLHLGAALDLQA